MNGKKASKVKAKAKPASPKREKKRLPETGVPITTEWIKLDSLLKLAGVAFTGGEAKEMVLEGIILVDGDICLERGRKLHPGQRVTVDNRQVLVVTAERQEPEQ